MNLKEHFKQLLNKVFKIKWKNETEAKKKINISKKIKRTKYWKL